MSRTSDFCDMCDDRLSDVCNVCVGDCTDAAWKVAFHEGMVVGAAIIAWAEAIRQRCTCPPALATDYSLGWDEVCERCKGYP